MIKILFISTLRNVDWGGSEELWSQSASHLIGRGYEVEFVTYTSGQTSQVKALISKGAKPHYVKKDNFFKKILKQRVGYNLTESLLRKVKPDMVVVSLSSYFLGGEWLLTCNKLKIPFSPIFQIVSSEIRIQANEVISLKGLLQNSTRNYFVSHQNKTQMEKHISHNLSNSEIVWNPFKGDLSKAFEYPKTNDIQQLAVVASYTPSHKGQDILFEVMSSPKWKQRDLQINLFGKGAYKEYLQDLIKFYDLKNVTLNDHQPIETIWATHHGMILPSRKEGMSLAMIEAMVIGRFCITTDVGGAREIISDNENGFIAAAPTVGLLDEALERAWQRRDEWEDISKKAYAAIRERIVENPAAYLGDKIIASLG